MARRPATRPLGLGRSRRSHRARRGARLAPVGWRTTLDRVKQSPSRADADTRQPGYAEPWQREVISHWPEYASELIGTAFLVFCVVTVVAWMLGSGSPVPSLIPSLGLRLLITGLLLGGAGSLVAVTPPGRLSGAHLNPAASVSFWVGGRMQPQDLPGYIAGQCIGAVLGAAPGVMLWGGLARSVGDAVNQPGPNVSALGALGGELAATFALTLVVFICLSHPRTVRWTPVGAMFAVGVLVWADANFSGASMNPARSLGPAVIAGTLRNYWVYVVGPIAGASAAAAAHRWLTPFETRTGKIFHTRHYRSIFTGPADHRANEHVRARRGQAEHETPRVHR